MSMSASDRKLYNYIIATMPDRGEADKLKYIVKKIEKELDRTRKELENTKRAAGGVSTRRYIEPEVPVEPVPHMAGVPGADDFAEQNICTDAEQSSDIGGKDE